MTTTELDEEVVVGPEMAGTLMTPEEFDSQEDWDENFVYELIHGVLIVSPPPSVLERGPNELLGNLLFVYREFQPEGTVLDATLPEHTVRTPASRRRADRVIWTGLGRTPNPARDIPSIVVEFVSAGKRSRLRDYVEKRREYQEAGVQEYWIFDRFRRTLTVFRNDAPEQVIPEDGTYQTPLLPGFTLPVGRLLAAADRWKAADR